MNHTRIDLQPATQYRADTYGVLLTSITEHDVTGRGVHNRYHPHSVDVWENRNGSDPMGNPADQPYSYLLTARATAITAHRETPTPQGAELRIGDLVDLHVHGYKLGTFRIDARPLSDPHLVPVS